MKLKEIVSIAGLQYFSMGLNFLIQLYLTFLLAPEVFGVFAKLAAIKEIFGALLAVNIPMAVIYIKEKEFKKLLSTSFFLGLIQGAVYLAGGIILALISWLFWGWNRNEIIILYILVVGISLSSIHQVLFSIFEKQELFKFNSAIVVVVQLFTGLVVIAISLITKDIMSLVIRDILPGIILLGIYLILVLKKWGASFIKWSVFDKSLSKEMLVYSFKMYFSRTIETFLFKLDILFASAYFNTGLVGIYERIKYFASLPQSLITSIIFRINLVKYSKNDNIQNLQRTNSISLLINFSSFIILYFILFWLDKYFLKGINDYLYPVYIFFFAYAGLGSIIENIKTYFYATNRILKSAIILRLVPLIIFSLPWLIIPQTLSINIAYCALLFSFSVIFPIVFLEPNLYRLRRP